jgi:hypothetical protein
MSDDDDFQNPNISANPHAAQQAQPHAEKDMTIFQWCAKHNYSLTTFYKLEREGNAPEVIRPPGIAAPRITPRADREWEEKMLRLAKEEAGRLETERRSQIKAAAGRAAAASPNHISQRRVAAKQKRAAATQDRAPPPVTVSRKRGRPRKHPQAAE